MGSQPRGTAIEMFVDQKCASPLLRNTPVSILNIITERWLEIEDPTPPDGAHVLQSVTCA